MREHEAIHFNDKMQQKVSSRVESQRFNPNPYTDYWNRTETDVVRPTLGIDKTWKTTTTTRSVYTRGQGSTGENNQGKGPTTGHKWKSWDKKVQKADKRQEVNYREHKGTQDYHDETLHAKATDFDNIFDLKNMHKKTCNPFLTQSLNGRNSQLSGCPNTSVKTP